MTRARELGGGLAEQLVVEELFKVLELVLILRIVQEMTRL